METSRSASPSDSGSSRSMSSGVVITPSDVASLSFSPLGDGQSRELTEHLATIHLNPDIPLPSTEGDPSVVSSGGSPGGVNISRRTAQSEAPTLSLSPPPDDIPETHHNSREDGFRRNSVSREVTDSINGHLGMSEITAAIESITRNADNSNVLLQPQPPTVRNSSQRPIHRRRSSSQTHISPHDVRDEEPPQGGFHDPTFQRAFADARQLMFDLAEVLSSSPFSNEPNSTIRRLQQEAEKLARFRCPSTRIVGFVGDSGVGKSSILNSLLDSRGLARTSNSGAACTCIVTEYHYHDRDDFVIDIEWLSMNEITTQLLELLQSYRHYHLHSAEIEQEDRKYAEDRADIAKNTFRAMFKQRLGDERFLIQLPEETVMNTLRSWAEELAPSSADREIQSSLEDCSAQLMRLTSEQNSDQETEKWPYIHKVKVHLKSHILSNGLVLVDLPGLRDLNSARRNITERYLLHCDGIFAICQIGRATSDASVESVFDLARQANLRNVGIICTKSDEIQPEEAKRDWNGERSRNVQRLIHAIDTDRQDVENIQADIDSFPDDDDLDEEEYRELRELTRRSRQTKIRRDQHQLELKQYLINTRNTIVSGDLDASYRNRVPGNDLKIFCVSNSEYWGNRDLSKDDALPLLELSGIISVRKHCISMVADNQLQISTKYIRDDIPALMGDIELWIQSGAGSASVEQKEAIRRKLDTIEGRLKGELTGHSCTVSTIARSFRTIFRVQISEKQRVRAWTIASSNASKTWSNWHHATFKRFCQKYGDHYTETVGGHNWNEEMIEQMARDLITPWQNLRSCLQNKLDENYRAIENLMDWAVENLAELHNPSSSTNTVIQAMATRQRLLLSDIEKVYKKFGEDASILKTDAFSGIRSSFIGTLMEKSYDECNDQLGSGSDKRRKNIINRRLEDESLFESLQMSFKNEFGTLADGLQSEIEAAIERHLVVITNTMDIVRDENVVLESERDPDFRGRVETKVGEVNREIHRIHTVINL